MDRLIDWIVYNDLINYANFFLASFIGSAAGVLHSLSNDKCEIKKLPYVYLSNGILGGFVGMVFTQFTNLDAVTYGIAGLTGGVGLKETLRILRMIEGFKITNEGDKDDDD